MSKNKIIKILSLTGLIFFMAACQKEFNAPPALIPTPIITEHEIAAIVITNGTQGDYDSVVYRYANDKTNEIHYNYFGDSIIRTYYYDVSGRLAKLEDGKAIYYTNNNKAKSMVFMYNNSGELIETVTDFETVSGVKAFYNNTISADAKSVIIYDTSYRSASYNLDWVNRIIYNNVSLDNTLLYDSAIFNNYAFSHTKTEVSYYSYDADNNARSITKLIYQDSVLAERGTTSITNDKPAPLFEALRKKLYRNLANWYHSSSVRQDDNYQLFPVPGGMYKSINYEGHSESGGALSENVVRNYTFENTYSHDELFATKVTYILQGQGSTHYTFGIRYYYQ